MGSYIGFLWGKKYSSCGWLPKIHSYSTGEKSHMFSLLLQGFFCLFGGWTLRQGVSSLADLQLWVMLKMTQKWPKYHSFNQYRMQWVLYWVYYGVLVFWAWKWRKEMILETAIEMGKVMTNQWNGPGSALSSQIQCSGLIYHTTPLCIISIIYI